MGPAAILNVLVKTQGARAAAGDLLAVDKAGKRASGNLAAVDKQSRKTSRGFGALGGAAKYAAGFAGLTGMTVALKAVGDEYREAQKTGAQTQAVLKSTGGVAKITTKEIESLAGAISKKTAIDDEAIQSGENLLLTFTNIRNEAGKGNDIFNRATQTITDMSVALGQGMKTSAIQVGKALQDPVKGITALRRVGVAFTQQQQDQIEKMVKSGDTLGAQRKILKELTKEFGGSAAAQATAGDKLRVSLGNLAEAAGTVLVPALDTVASYVTGVIDAFLEGKGIAKVIIPVFEAIADFAKQLDPQALQIAAAGIAGIATSVWLLNAALSANVFVLIAVGVAALGVALVTAYQKVEWFRTGVDTAFAWLKGAAQTVAPVMVAVFGQIWNAVKVAAGGIADAVSWVITAFQNVVGWVRTAVKNTIAEIGKWKVAFAVIGVIVDVVKAVFPVALAIVKTYMGLIWGGIKLVMGQVVNAFKTAWNIVKAVFSGAFQIIKGLVTGLGTMLHGVIVVIGGILKGDFGQMWDGVKTIFKGAFKILMGFVNGFKTAFVGVIVALGEGIWNAFKGAFQSAKSIVVGFVNDIIDIINKLPFIKDIEHVSAGGGSVGGARNVDLSTTTGRLARGGAYGATGGSGVVNKPMVMMGEEAPMWPEFVIPTNPAYRKRAQNLAAAAGQAVGMAKGGILSSVTGAAGDVLGAGAGALLKALPDSPFKGGPLAGLGTTLLAKAGAFIKDKAKAALDAVTPGGGGGGGATVKATGGRLQLPKTFRSTHDTDGLPSYPYAIDVFAKPGTKALSPVSGKITRFTGQAGGPGGGGAWGYSMYLDGEGMSYYLTHFGARNVKVGQSVSRGDVLGLVADYPGGVPDHIHQAATHLRKGGIIGKAAGKIRGLAAGGVTGNVRAVAKFLRGKGFTPAQVAGIIGTMQGESGPGLSTTAQNPTSGAYGIAQWLGGRKTALMGKRNPSSLQTQLNHLWSELQGPESAAYQRIKGAHSIDDAVVAWMDGFERGAPHERQIGARTANARAVFKGLGGANMGGGGGGGGGSSQSREQIQARIRRLADRADRLRAQQRNVPSGKKGAAQRKTIQDKLASIATQTRHLRERMQDAPKATGGPSVLESKQAAFGLQAAELARRVGGDITSPETFANTAFARAGKGYDLANANRADKILKGQQQAIGKRIKQLRAALKEKGHSRAARTRWQSELAGLIPQHAELGKQRSAIRHPQAPAAVDTGAGGDTGDPNQGLIDAINAQIEQERINAEAMRAHTEALTAVGGELKRQTDFGQAVMTTENFQLKKMIADVVGSGLGASLTRQSFTPGYGQVASY